jgi:hypothetical protein
VLSAADIEVARWRLFVWRHPGLGEVLCAASRDGAYDEVLEGFWTLAQAERPVLELMHVPPTRH